MKSLHDIAMDICRIRDRQEPVHTGQIRKGHAGKGDMTLTPGLRKTTLADARKLCELNHGQLNDAANQILEHDKIRNEAIKMLQDWVRVIRRGDMGDFSPVMDEIFDTEELLKRLLQTT